MMEDNNNRNTIDDKTNNGYEGATRNNGYEGATRSPKKKIMMKKRLLACIIVLSFLLGVAGGVTASYFAVTSGGEYVSVEKDTFNHLMTVYEKYGKLDLLYNSLKANYYQEVSDEDLMNGIYKGLFESTGDPYTMYLTSEEYENLINQSTGEFYGIGITFTATEEGDLIIISTIEGSPAERAGLKTGDIIVAVDGVRYTASELDEAGNAMRGELNTKVTVTYRRGDEEHDITIIRKKITTQSVYSEVLDDNIGYIRITTFDLSTGDDFEKELRSMEVKGVNGLIIDLRNNGGGIVDSGTKIADLLLPEGTIIYLEDKAGERVYYNSDSSCTSLPYVLLVNGGTASTSEILAVAVKENGGGKLVGTQTFGKGIVQSVNALTDGTGMRTTVQQYFSPKGNVIQGKGVTPDYIVELPLDSNADLQLEKAIELIKEY